MSIPSRALWCLAIRFSYDDACMHAKHRLPLNLYVRTRTASKNPRTPRNAHTAMRSTAFMNATVEIRTLFQQIKFSSSESAFLLEIWQCFAVISQSNFRFQWYKKQHAWHIANLLLASYTHSALSGEFISEIVKFSSQHERIHANDNIACGWNEICSLANMFVWQINGTYLRHDCCFAFNKSERLKLESNLKRECGAKVETDILNN